MGSRPPPGQQDDLPGPDPAERRQVRIQEDCRPAYRRVLRVRLVTKLIQTIIIGLEYGCVYSLIAMGMVLVYRTTGVLNIAHGGIGVLAGFVAWDLVRLRHWPYYPGLLAGIAFAVVLGLAFERWVVRRLPNAGSQTVATLGLFLLAQGVVFAVPWWSNNSAQAFPSPFTGKTVRTPGADYAVSPDQLLLVAPVVPLFLGLRF